ncbi:MAG: hypothetical protein MZV63_13725 [Marinilabiliales bacterium]|nr:hypothetical protein [Marinilabiliales bacterium]
MGDFAPASVVRPSPDLLRVRFEGQGDLAGLAVEAEYRLAPRSWYVRKLLRVINGRTGPIVVRDATVDAFRIESVPLPEKAENPVFLDGQLFWGLEWPIAEAAVRDGRLALGHFPAAEVPPGGTWTSKTSGFGVSAAGRIEEAFGRYIQEIRANRVDFATFYFDWLCHDNSGPRESEVLANFAALRRLKELYGLQFDIYNSDAGLVESQGTYYPQFKANFLIAVPGRPEAPGRGVEGARDAPRALARPGRLRRDARGDGRPPGAAAVLGPGLQRRPVQDGHRRLGARPPGQVHPGEEISEPGRRPGRGAAHRPGIRRHQSPHQRLALHADHHGLPSLARRRDLHRRPHQQRDGRASTTATAPSAASSLRSSIETPFRQFEDHGICFNSCLEKWEDDLVAQAFGRASVLSPEMYGTFFFLGDEDYPRLARLIQLHKRLEPLLKTAYPLPGGDIAHADGRVVSGLGAQHVLGAGAQDRSRSTRRSASRPRPARP